MKAEAAEAIAIDVLTFLAEDAGRLGRFLGQTGLAPEALRSAAKGIVRGQVLALKGLGGFQLLVDATNARAIARICSSHTATRLISASCSSSASRTKGHASSWTCAIASGSNLPKSSRSWLDNVLRATTARVLRSSSGAGSRKE